MAPYTLAIFLVFYDVHLPRLDLDTKVLSHSAQGWLWLEWWYCLCLASLSLEVNLSWHLSHSTLSTSLCALALCSRACGWLLKAWPQILHPKAACPSAASDASIIWWWRLCWSHTSHTLNCTTMRSDCAGYGNRNATGPAQLLCPAVQPLVWPVWFQHNRRHPFEVALDPALTTSGLTSAVFVAKLSEVGPRPWSTRLLLTVRLRAWSVASVRRGLPQER